MAPYPEWLHILSLAFLSFSLFCAAIIIIDELRRLQEFAVGAIQNVVKAVAVGLQQHLARLTLP